ncbi:MAG: NifB/NifX family molybdenum-iron cluster-binding protein [Desulfobacterales bacterium]|jgi:predicted Fe-Mo cluster-binding NifX family protein|nr:NifB/NifX family molybdenum-iron cluster-binding protein [Desulfobacterales bacterium]MDD3081468.1 NifB/NifX family molybdenum-iron cluster-binding protein [Desulfobacterales bacterium]MDD3950383.1 NifB/NifX family molybdenum-iron cluster-binding protein [Desulfobacterales bacterium]MDD4463018.1 NifB/NifX family molybdenum-iron cluster-binding protein [Desulfobacterales bacterium]MDY0378223.1 NifB/NifX family molybdenum-iron cluster-binding protein [Desulfobacterales bacterium]
MKILISSQGNTPDSAVNPRFSRAPWFMVYDDALQTWTAFDNSKGMDVSRGAGIQAAQTVSDLGAKVVISGIMGPKAYKAMNAAGIQIYIGASNTVRQALEAYKNGKLTLADEKSASGV